MAFQNLKTGIKKPASDPVTGAEQLEMIVRKSDDDQLELSLEGNILPGNAQYFKDGIEGVHAQYPAAHILLDCDELALIDPLTVPVIRELLDEGISLCFNNLNQDCYAALWEAGLDGIVGKHIGIPHYDLEDYHVIGEGANGRVYRINDELIMKTFKNKEPLSNILKERYLTKCAFQVGLPCPISFGLAEAEGKIVLLMELVKSKSLAKMIRADEYCIGTYVRPFVELIKTLHNVKGDSLNLFPRKKKYHELLRKADILDEYMDEGYKGRLREILESIDKDEVLLHGDIQPANIRVSDEGLSFIDLETISTGPEIMDIGALRRSLHCDWEFSDADYSEFMKLPKDQLIKMWDIFVKTYYEGMDEKEVEKNLYLAELIGDTLSAAQYAKRGQMDQVKRAVARMEELIDKRAEYE